MNYIGSFSYPDVSSVRVKRHKLTFGAAAIFVVPPPPHGIENTMTAATIMTATIAAATIIFPINNDYLSPLLLLGNSWDREKSRPCSIKKH
jgi:hypothetical protein